MCVLPYFDVRDCLSVVDRILVKGESVVVPMTLTPSIKRRLHSAHLGRDSMLCRARGTVYWPNIASDIKQIADVLNMRGNETAKLARTTQAAQ